MAKGILLEAGTNEMELLIFQLDGTVFGVNVAKVRELIPYTQTRSIPGAPAAIAGSFQLREQVLTLVSLREYLGIKEPPGEDQKPLIIVIEFNDLRCGVLVDGVEMIHRLRWEQIEPPSAYLVQHNVPITSVARIGDRVALVLDFERIVGELLGHGGMEIEEVEDPPEIPERSVARVLIADDSPLVRQAVARVLRNAGYKDVTICSDGQEAWETIERTAAGTDGLPYDLVLTDIEMPRMDGLHLTARIKERPEWNLMPVVLFSSLVRSDTAERWRSVGADAQITKFDQESLVASVEECLAKVRLGNRA